MTDAALDLRWPDVLAAAFVGMMRHYCQAARNLPERQPANPRQAWDRHINGAISEFAVAKWGGWFWEPAIGRTGGTDVAGFQVRSVGEPFLQLCMRSDEAVKGEVWVSVLLPPGANNRPVLRGWFPASDMRPEWFDQKHKLYFVPNDRLRPMDTLPPPTLPTREAA